MRHHEDQAVMAEGLERWLRGNQEATAPQLRRDLGASGWLWPADDGLLLPRAHHVVTVGEALGRAMAPVPWSSLVLAAVLLEHPAWPDGPRWLRALAAGEPSAAVLPPAPAGRPSLAIDASPGRPLLRVGDRSLTWLPAGSVPMQALRTLDGHPAAWVQARPAGPGSHVMLQGAEADALRLRATDWALLASCAYVCGLLQRLVEHTVEHAATRRQFGVAVGTFQAVRHRCVDMHVAAQELRALVHASADHLDAPDRPLVLARLKLKCVRSARLVAQGAVQLHGAMGLTEELPVGRAVLAIEAELQRHASAGACGARLQRALLGETP